MNYFTHAVRYLDRPLFAAGVCVPDWLSVVDRKARVRGKRIEQELSALNDSDREIALGIKQHLDDDRWFHGTPAFYRVTGELARIFKVNLPVEDEWRCGFLGHIIMELLLDSALIEYQPEKLQRFYRVLEEVNHLQVQEVTSALATKRVTELARLIGAFTRERFFDDYLQDDRLLFRLNQVMRRIQLDPLPEQLTDGLAEGRIIVRQAVHDLLPPEYFPERSDLPL